MENIIERIAMFLKKDPLEIREQNFRANEENLVSTVIFPMLKKQASYEQRRLEINQFNKVRFTV